MVLSKLDEATLQQIAQIGGGQYFRATAAGGELSTLIAELNSLQKGELSSQIETWGIERFQSFLWVALITLIAVELIPDRISQKAAKKRAAMGGQSPSTNHQSV